MNFDSKWTLFLDRDGVINKKIEGDYVKDWNQFVFCDGVLIALKKLAEVFFRIIIVTNQRGIGKKIMTVEQLNEIHQKMLDQIFLIGGKIDKIYYCPNKLDSATCRKPNIGMGLNAKLDFPEIDFSKSIMVGDSISDMEFGKKLRMKSVFISSENRSALNSERNLEFDLRFNSLLDFAQNLHLIDIYKLGDLND